MSFFRKLFPDRGPVEGQVRLEGRSDLTRIEVACMGVGQTGIRVNWEFWQGMDGELWMYSLGKALIHDREIKPWEVRIRRTDKGVEVLEGVVQSGARGSVEGGPGTLPVMRLAEGVSVEVEG